MKRLSFFLLLFVLFCGMASAQSYNALWKDVTSAMESDRPATALKSLRQISAKAEAEKEYGHLLLSYVTELSQQREISNDSLDVAMQRLMKRYEKAKNENGVMATVLRTVLSEKLQKPDVDSLLNSPDAHIYTKENSAFAYEPLVVREQGSRYFNHDLISLIALETQQYAAMSRYYERIGNREAAIIFAIKDGDLMYKGDIASRMSRIDSVLNVWGKWEGVNTLRNIRNGETSPQISVHSKEEYNSNTDIVFRLECRNVTDAQIRIYPLKYASRKCLDEPIKDIYRKYAVKNRVKSYGKMFDKHPEYEYFNDSVNIGKLPVGAYYVECSDSKKRLKSSSSLLFVTDLKVISISQPKEKTRVVVVNAITGEPVAGAKLHILGNEDRETVLSTDDNGEHILSRFNGTLYATDADDNAMPAFRLSNYGSFYNPGSSNNISELIFTDRKIYRPGQTVKAAILTYNVIDRKELSVRNGASVKITLRDTRGLTVGEQTVKTDEYGTAYVDFVLPTNGTNGNYRISTRYGSTNIRVEEYVRPTFYVTLDSPETAYHNGDTVTVKGIAKTYSGIGVANARVSYSVVRRNSWWWRQYSDNHILLNDTVQTASDGSFTIRMPMIMDSTSNKRIACYYNIEAQVQVVDQAGESHSAVIALPLSNRETYLGAEINDKILADSAVNITFWRRNAAGKNVDGIVSLELNGKNIGEIEANKVVNLSDIVSYIPSGKHNITGICGNDTVKTEFVVFRLDDKMPATDTHDWFYATSSKFPYDGGDVKIQFGGIDENINVFYAVYSQDKMLESGRMVIESGLTCRSFRYKEEYGDGICYVVAWVKNGELFTHSHTIEKALPKKDVLNVQWTSFRDKTVPGNKEQWTLSITNADGSPARAQLMATLYDKSLDAIIKHDWNIYDPRHLVVPYISWRSNYVENFMLGCYPQNMPYYKELQFSHFKETYIYREEVLHVKNMYYAVTADGAATNRVTIRGTGAVKQAKLAKAEVADARLFDVVSSSQEEENSMEPQSDGTEAVDVPVRENLSELAMFVPAVETDENGIVSLAFTLPESVTTWRFMGLSHDKEMNTGSIRGEVIAQKKLMVQPRVPRFLRERDNAVISTSVSNLTDNDIVTKVTMRLVDEETGKQLASTTKKLAVKVNESAVASFDIDASKYGERVIAVRITAEGGGHSDGEQHLLPILSGKETVVNTIPFNLLEKGTAKFDITKIIPRDAENAQLNVSYTDNPQRLLIDALPYVKTKVDDNAISLVGALYANVLASYVCDSLYDKNDIAYRAKDIASRLSQLQNADGSWPWWRGMNPSRYVTMEVYKTLVRLNRMIGKGEIATIMGNRIIENIMSRADSYLKNEITADVERMKKEEKRNVKPTLSPFHIDYLYCIDKANTSATSYLYKYLESSTIQSDMATKAQASYVFANNGDNAKAKSFAESIIEHTVYREDIGRYFDSYRANYSWYNYRIPTQTAVIEALQMMEPTKENRKTIREMQRWLLQSKRTQQWDTPINAVNAIYAFFGGQAGSIAADVPTTIRLDGKVLGKDKVSTPITGTKHQVSIEKTTEIESWGTISVEFKQTQESISSASSGLNITRTYSNSNAGSTFKVGDKVKVTITVVADRDYDFVTISDNRPACFEPVSQLSGYRNGAYTVQHDNSTEFYFEKFNKGKHTLETEYYVSRPGTYNAGTATVTCTYSPEFTGRCAGEKITVSDK